LARINYQHEKRVRDLAKKKKQEEKRLNKLNKKNSDNPENSDLPVNEQENNEPNKF